MAKKIGNKSGRILLAATLQIIRQEGRKTLYNRISEFLPNIKLLWPSLGLIPNDMVRLSSPRQVPPINQQLYNKMGTVVVRSWLEGAKIYYLDLNESSFSPKEVDDQLKGHI